MTLTGDRADNSRMPRRQAAGLTFVAVVPLLLTSITAPLVATIPSFVDAVRVTHPYVVPGHELVVYALSPLFAASVVTMLLAPGMLLVYSRGRHQRPNSWPEVVALGFLVSFGLRVALHALAKLAGSPMTPTTFWTLEVALVGISGAWALARGTRSAPPTGSSRILALVPIIPAISITLLAPQIFWQPLTQDGFEALEVGRSLTHAVLPRTMSGDFWGLGEGIISMSFPVSWFIQILGPTEVASRLPLILYLPVLAALLVGLAEAGRRRSLDSVGLATIMLVLLGYTAVMAYNATYEPYGADLGSPTGFETFTLVCLAGLLLGLWQEHRGILIGFAALGFFARPTVLLFVVFLIAATLVGRKTDERRRQTRDLALVLLLFLIVFVAYEKGLLPWVSDGAYRSGAGSLLDRYQYLRYSDLRRFVWTAVPGGVLPLLSVIAFKWQDRLSRQLSLALVLYFVAFFLPAFVALHHFVPLMVLPVVVFLRLTQEGYAWTRYVGLAACIVTAGVSLPDTVSLEIKQRALAERIAFGAGEYGGEPEAHRRALASLVVAPHLFPYSRDVSDPSMTLVGASHAFLHYSTRAGVTIADADYAILDADAPSPTGYTEVARERDFVAYVRDLALWTEDLADTPSVNFGDASFVIPRETLFWFIGVPAGAYDIDLSTTRVLWRLFERATDGGTE